MVTSMDIAVCIDCSSSIASYFGHIRSNILSIFNQILFEHQNDVHMALIEFRSHTDDLVTNTHPFTTSLHTFEDWINAIRTESENANECKAIGDAFDASLTLEWRSIVENSYASHEKLVILITDGPPCNLINDECLFNDKDLWKKTDEFIKQDITLVVIGIEPSVVVCDDFYCALAKNTGGEYIPFVNAKNLLTSVIRQALVEEYTITQLFRHCNIHLDIEQGSRYKYSYVEKRVHFMIKYCRTMTDIRKLLYIHHDQSTKFFIDKINNNYDYWHNANRKIESSTPTGDDEGYRTRLPTTASSLESSFIQIMSSPTVSIYSDFDWNGEIDNE